MSKSAARHFDVRWKPVSAASRLLEMPKARRVWSISVASFYVHVTRQLCVLSKALKAGAAALTQESMRCIADCAISSHATSGNLDSASRFGFAMTENIFEEVRAEPALGVCFARIAFGRVASACLALLFHVFVSPDQRLADESVSASRIVASASILS